MGLLLSVWVMCGFLKHLKKDNEKSFDQLTKKLKIKVSKRRGEEELLKEELLAKAEETVEETGKVKE